MLDVTHGANEIADSVPTDQGDSVAHAEDGSTRAIVTGGVGNLEDLGSKSHIAEDDAGQLRAGAIRIESAVQDLNCVLAKRRDALAPDDPFDADSELVIPR